MHDTGVSGPDHEGLFHVAAEQGGYFTAVQARRQGFSKALLAHHAGAGGRFVRIRRGLYRFRQYPTSPREDVLAAWLAANPGVAVISHESALDLLKLSDVVPKVVHLTVPRSRRYRPQSPGVQVHTTTRDLAPADVVIRDGMRITSAARSILDTAEARMAPEQVIAAVRQALERGMTTERRLRAAAAERGGRVDRLETGALRERSKPNSTTLEAMQELEERRGARFDTAEELFEDVGI